MGAILSIVALVTFLAVLLWRECIHVRNQQMLAKLMDCTYVQLMGKDIFIPLGKEE